MNFMVIIGMEIQLYMLQLYIIPLQNAQWEIYMKKLKRKGGDVLNLDITMLKCGKISGIDLRKLFGEFNYDLDNRPIT